MKRFKQDCVQKGLETMFYDYGKFVAKYPLPFLIGPLVVTFGFALGLCNFELIEDTEYLYSPIHGRAKDERKIIEHYFPSDTSSSFLPSRKMSLQGFVQVLIKNSHSGNIYDSRHFERIEELNEIIEGTTVLHGDNEYNYTLLCASWKGDCATNSLLQLVTSDPDLFQQTSYPFHGFEFLGTQLGGVSTDGYGHITTAEAVLLNYFLRYETDDDVAKADLWIGKVKTLLLGYADGTIEIYFQTSLSIEEELRKATISIIPLFAVTYTVLCFFSVLTCMMLDWVCNV